MRTFLLIPFAAWVLAAQPAPPALPPVLPPAQVAGAPAGVAPQGAGNDEVLKRIDDVMWHLQLDDVAHIDRSEYTSLPPVRTGRGAGAGNPLIIRAYTFIPKSLDRTRKQPLVVFCHQ